MELLRVVGGQDVIGDIDLCGEIVRVWPPYDASQVVEEALHDVLSLPS
jgi:hypothetical protein